MNLNEFLANGKDDQRGSAVTHAAAMYSNRSMSWADESEDLNTQGLLFFIWLCGRDVLKIRL